MKKIFLMLSLILISITYVNAQKDAISKYFSVYEDDRDFTVVRISGRMFSMFSNLEVDDPHDQRVLDAISDLTGLKILSIDDIDNGFSMYRKAIAKISEAGYEELMTVRESDHDLKFFIQESEGKIIELVMISGGNHEFTILSLVGLIRLEDLSDLSKSLEIDGLENLDKIEKNKN